MICKYIYCPKFIRIIWSGKYKITNEICDSCGFFKSKTEQYKVKKLLLK